MEMKKIAYITLALFLISILPSVVSAQNEKVCAVYVTGIGCPVCAHTDPIVLTELTEKYPNLVMIEYEIYDQSQDNSLVASEYFESYLPIGVQRGIPFLTFDKVEWYIGMEWERGVPQSENLIKSLSSNGCPLLNGSSVSFKDLDINSLLGKPKIWMKDKVLVACEDGNWIFQWDGLSLKTESGTNSINNELLKKLLTNEDLDAILEGIKFEIIEPEPVLLSGIKFPTFGVLSKVEFSHAIRIGERTEEEVPTGNFLKTNVYWVVGFIVFIIAAVFVWKKVKFKVVYERK